MKMLSALRPQKGRAPVPSLLPGSFFVLEYDRESDAFTLRVDDEDYSTYDLGSDIAELQILFRMCKSEVTYAKLQPQQIDRMIDIAREFRMAQYIPQRGELVEDRVLSILPRSAHHKGLNLNVEEVEENNWIHGLR